MILRLVVFAVLFAASVPLIAPSPIAAAPQRKSPRMLDAGVVADSAAQARSAAGAADRYIVTFRDDVTDPRGLALQLGRDQGGAVTHVYRHALKGFAAKLP